jgi:hypothetical protein
VVGRAPHAHGPGLRGRSAGGACEGGRLLAWAPPGRWAGSEAGEFAGKWHDDAGSPVQLLFQRLDEPDGPVRAHLDLGTDNVEVDVRRILDLGAADIGPGRGWWALRDPTGLPFCVTGNSPMQTPQRDIG